MSALRKSNPVRFLSILSFLLFLTFGCKTQGPGTTKIYFEADTTGIFPNPERGWRAQAYPPCCDYEEELSQGIVLPPHDPFTVDQLLEWRNSEDAITVFKDDVKIQQWDSDIPQSRLDELQSDYDTIRAAGLKQIFRLLYNWGMSTLTPPPDVINKHLDQLAPLLQKNADVIFAVEFAMFGGTGEAVDAPGYLEDENNGWSSLNEEALKLYHKLMDIVPKDRMLLIHYPRYKFDMMGWENGNEFPTQAKPVTEENAFDGSDIARMGYYNDNFAGDENHWGFFYAWPEQEKAYTKKDALYVPMTGELSGATDFNKENGSSEMRKYHFTAYQQTGDGGEEVISYWKKTGQYDEMARKLGYRFRLVSATIPEKLNSDEVFTMELEMANDGWARIMNPRNVEIILRNQSSGEKFEINIEGDNRGNRLWLPGPEETKTLVISESLPADIPQGTYDLFLNLPDPYPSIHDRPEYSIRLANKNIWEPNTGFNSLNHSIEIAE